MLRGPTKYYPQPYDDIITDETSANKQKGIRKCIEINDTQVLSFFLSFIIVIKVLILILLL